MSKCICEVCKDSFTNHPNWIKTMSNEDDILRATDVGYNSIALMAAEYEGRLWLSGYVMDRRRQAYASGYFPRYCPECGKKLEN